MYRLDKIPVNVHRYSLTDHLGYGLLDLFCRFLQLYCGISDAVQGGSITSTKRFLGL